MKLFKALAEVDVKEEHVVIEDKVYHQSQLSGNQFHYRFQGGVYQTLYFQIEALCLSLPCFKKSVRNVP